MFKMIPLSIFSRCRIISFCCLLMFYNIYFYDEPSLLFSPPLKRTCTAHQAHNDTCHGLLLLHNPIVCVDKLLCFSALICKFLIVSFKSLKDVLEDNKPLLFYPRNARQNQFNIVIRKKVDVNEDNNN